jgi:hypothetical protein
MVMKDAFAILRADKQLQSSVHDFALCFQAREFFRLADQGFVNVDVGASHKHIIHQFYQDWCIDAEELTSASKAGSVEMQASLMNDMLLILRVTRLIHFGDLASTREEGRWCSEI